MTLGIHVYNLPAHDVLQLAREAEARGFDGFWIGEHVVLPAAYSSLHPGRSAQTTSSHAPILELDTALHDPWVTMGAIASATSRIQIGLGVYLLPLRHPLLTARAAASAHDFSGGRFTLGTGVGWLAEEFTALDARFADRGARVNEMLAILRLAWAGGVFEYQGAHYDIAALQVTNTATPVPLVIGGNSARGLNRAVAFGDGWMASGTPELEQACMLRADLARRLEEAGRTDPFRCIVRVNGLGRDVVARYVEHGLDDLTFHVNAGVADRHGGWKRWLDEVSTSVEEVGARPVGSPS